MKIFRVTYHYDKFWRAVTNIGGVDVIHIDADNHISKNAVNRITDEHFITYDKKDMHGPHMGMSNISENLMLIKDKVLERIEDGEDIIIISHPFALRNDCINDFLAVLKREKEFSLHLLAETYGPVDDDALNELRLLHNFHIFSSFCCVTHRSFRRKDNSFDAERYYKYEIDKLSEIIPKIIGNSEHQTIYDHRLKAYKPIVLPKDFLMYRHETHSFMERITSNRISGKVLCKQFHELRREYAKENSVKIPHERNCTYKGKCKGVCRMCDMTSEDIWELNNKNTITRNSKEFTVNEITGIFNGIERLRIDTDGKGVRSLILMADCPLECRYCCNREINKVFPQNVEKTPLELGSYLHKDGIYFEKTGGGVTFGGGEPLLQADFIVQFGRIYSMWNIDIETSLNIEWSEVEKLLDIVDVWHIDIKDMDPDIYKAYTGCDNSLVTDNLARLIKLVPAGRLHIRVPEIAGFNTKSDIENSVSRLRAMGFTDIEVFDYIVER